MPGSRQWSIALPWRPALAMLPMTQGRWSSFADSAMFAEAGLQSPLHQGSWPAHDHDASCSLEASAGLPSPVRGLQLGLQLLVSRLQTQPESWHVAGHNCCYCKYQARVARVCMLNGLGQQIIKFTGLSSHNLWHVSHHPIILGNILPPHFYPELERSVAWRSHA